MKTDLVYSQKLPPRRQFPAATVLLYDAILDKQPFFKTWRQSFAHSWPLVAGENLKTIASFYSLLKKISTATIPQSTDLTFLAVGGGSVGDFVGFLASTFLRGRRFVQIPSTWLAAIDSAHGGKNGLNLAGVKNQVGTIYPAESVYLVKQLLESQPNERANDAMGEVLKIAIINTPALLKLISEKNLYSLLPTLIQAKLKVVAKDPLEKLGHRRVLNLGHTMGHVFESHFKLPHGQAVKLGILFSAKWSLHRKNLKPADYDQICIAAGLNAEATLHSCITKMNSAKILRLLSKDKKLISSSEIDFIFICKIGKVIRNKVSFSDVLTEVKRQKQEH